MFRRIGGAWQVLMGQRLVPFQIQSEWALYQQTFGAQLEQMSSYLARAAKAEKGRLKRLAESMAPLDDLVADSGGPPIAIVGGDRKSRKAALWRRVREGAQGAPMSHPSVERVS